MVASVSVARSRTFLNDADGDNVADPGDTFIHTIIITNTGPDDATNVLLTESENGLTIDSGSFKIGPIANDDSLGNCVGNTPLSFTAGQLTGNDLDPDDGTPTLTITKINNTAIVEDVPIAVTGGTVTMTSPGNFTFDPTAGFEGAASFTYEVTDDQGVTSVAATPGSVSITVTDPVWYIDSLNGSDVTGDGTFDNPFATMAPISTGGAFDTGAMEDDGGDTIFVYDRGGTYTTSIVLEAGQKLYGDSFALMPNGLTIGASSNNTSIQYNGVGVTLSTDNTIIGMNLTGIANGAIGIEDGGTSVTTSGGTLTIDNTSIMGSGKAVDIDQGGNLAVTLDTLSSQNSTTQGVQLAGTSGTPGNTGLLSGTFSATAGTIQTASDHNFQIGTGGGAFGGGTIAVDYDGALNTSISGSAVHIAGRVAGSGDIRFDGNIFQDSGASTSSDGIAITTVAAGNIFFTGTKTIDMVGANENAISVTANSGAVINFSGGALNLDTDSGHGFAISQTGGQVNVSTAADIDSASGRGISITGSTGGATNFTGGGLTITTTTGDALHSNNASSGSSLTISGSGNTLATTLGGQLVDIANTGSSGITFDTMNAGASVADDAIFVNNLDGGTWTTNTITIRGTTGAGSDGIVIQGGSSTNFSLGTVSMNHANAIADDGIEVNGTGGNPVGTVTATSVDIQNTNGQGVEINTYNNTVNVNGGAIGGVNDPGAEAVLITGNGGNVTIAASVTKNTPGNVVEVEDHDSGTITFSGAISATNNVDNGILINNSGGGTIAFTHATKTLTTGAFNAVTISNNGAAVDFTGGTLVINTTSGDGISAGTTSTSTGGDLTISGAGNTITSTTGSAFVLHGTDSDGITFQSINKNGGTDTAIFIKDAGNDGFTVTGTASTANSGGTLQNIGGTNGQSATGHGVYVENSGGIVLNNMLIGNGTTIGNFGIRGLNVTNFTLRDSVINGNSGDSAGGLLESAVFFNNLTGVGLFEGNNISGGYIDNMRIHNNAAGASTLNLFVRDSASDAAIFGSNGTTNDASDALNIQVSSDNNILALVDGVQFTAWRGDGLQATATNTANLEITVQNNLFNNAHVNKASAGGIGVVITGTAGGGSWGVDYTIQDNQFTGSLGPALAASFFSTGGGVARGFIDDNIIGTDNNAYGGNGSSEATGIFVDSERITGGTGLFTHYATVSDNQIRDTKQSGILVGARNGGDAVNNVITEIYITNNIVEEMGGASSFAALHMTAGGAATDFGIVRADITGNTFNIDGTTNAYAPIFLDQILGTSSKYEFPGHPGTNGDSAATDTYFDVTKANNFVLDAGQLDPGSFVFSPDAVIDNGVLQPAQTGSNTQLPTGAMQAAEPPADEPAAGDPAPSDPTPPTDDAGDPGDGGDGDSGDGDSTGGDPAPDPEPEPAPEPGHPVIADDNVLTQAELDWLVEAAIQRWADAGASDAQLAAMRATHFSVAEMSGLYLGSSSAGNVYVDSDGAGHGWFLDTTPGDNAEFAGSGTRLSALAGGDAAGRMDLLTVLMHELGHQVGLDDDYNVNQADELMYGYANLGERRLPAADDLIGADMVHAGHESFVESPMVIPLLPEGKAVKVTYTSTVDTFVNQVITGNPFSNTSTVTGDNFTMHVSDPETLLVDSLTLGGVVWNDNGNGGGTAANGARDGSEQGIQGVTLSLFVDANNDNVADSGTAIDTATTLVGGVYSFDNLAPGTYLVRVDQANFESGGALENLQISPVTSPEPPDPDNNLATDDNGSRTPGQAAFSKSIDLNYNLEPDGTPDVDGDSDPDTNLTLGFGFMDNPDPVIANLAGDVSTFTEDGPAVLLDDSGLPELAATVTDDQTHFNGGSLTASITGNEVTTEDVLGLSTAGTVTLSDGTNVGSIVSVGGMAVGTVSSDGTGGDDLVIDLDTVNATPARVSTLIQALTYSNSNSENPSELQRSVAITVDDGLTGTDTETVLVNVAGANDAPTAADDDITAIEDTFRTLSGTDFGFDDVDTGDILSEVIITGVTGGTLYIDTGADGFDDPGDAVSTFPATVTAAQLGSNLVAFKAAPNANGTGLGEISFKVVDDSGAANDTSADEYVLTVDVTAVNDAPTLQLSDTGPSATLNYDEGDAAAAMAPTAVLDDIDSANFGGGSLTVSFQANGTTADQLDVLSVGSISRSGTDILFGVTDIGDVSGGVNGADLVISLDSDATLARVEALIQAIGYSNSSDDPSELARTVNFLVDDGDGGTSTGQANATVNVNAINDGPVNTPGDPLIVNEDSGATTLSGMSIDDPDSAGDDIIVGFSVEHGTLGINTGVGGGITAGDIQFQDATTIVVVATRAQINTTLADAVGLTYTPDADYHGSDTLEIATNDNGENGDDPGLTGDANNEQDLDTRDITVNAVNDPVSSTVTTPINVDEDTAGALTLSIADDDTALSPNGVYEVTLTATNGTTTLTTLTGLTFTAGNGDEDAVMTFRGKLADINSALATATFTGTANFTGAASVKIDVTDDVLGNVATGSGAGTSDSDTIAITVDPVDDDPDPTGDSYTTNEATDISGQNLLANEVDPDGGANPTISEVNGESGDVNTEITLDSGAKLTVNSDGTFTYKPNGAFDELAEFGSGASNTLDTDSFKYTLSTGGEATVTITIQGDYSDPHLMLGTAGDDNITGTFFDDIFSPGAGADTMTGMQGDDIYEVDNVGDQTIEAFGQGNDEVRSTINWTLHKHLEDLTLLGAATDGTGNQLANTIVGNANNNVLDGLGGADEMRGGAGDDTYHVQNSADQAIETSLADGTDTVISAASQYTLGAFVENLILVGGADRGTGNGEANLIIGNAGGNVLDGKAGVDELRGGAGDDLYHVDNAGDLIVELNGGGSDTARATVSYTIVNGVNHLELAGTALNGTGNNGGNRITGNAQANLLKGLEGNDRLTGGGGDDLLVGGLGNDRLQGDAGADNFYFSTALNPATNVDEILDFSVADDTMRLNTAVFTAIGAGALGPGAFHTGALATDAAHRIIYNSATGDLYYDADGNGSAHDQILFATLDTGLALTSADFIGY